MQKARGALAPAAPVVPASLIARKCFFHRSGGKEILWGKRNFGDCKRIFDQAVVQTLKTPVQEVGKV
jgi:hypothetical protein